MLTTLDGFALGGSFDGRDHFDAQGVSWIMEKLDGWWGSPAPRTDRQDRDSAHGTYRGVAFRGARILALTGVLTAPTKELAYLAGQRIAAVCGDETKLYELAVQDPAGTFTARVELNGDVDPVQRDRVVNSLRFSIPLAAPDPRKFGPWVATSTLLGTPGSGGINTGGSGIVTSAPGISTGTPGVPGTVVAVNGGTAAVGPVLAIAGGIDGAVVTDTAVGDQLSIGTVPAGEPLFINCDDQPQQLPAEAGGFVIPGHGVLLGGYSNRRAQVAVWGSWPRIPRGASTRFLFSGTAQSGSPSLTVYTRSAWR